MNKIVNFLQKYFAVISVLIGISILLSVTFSSYIVTSNDHKAAEMYIGELKYSIEIDGSSTNTLTVPIGETIIDVKVNNLNPVDTYYKLLYLKNTNITVKYYESTKDTDDVVTTYNKPNGSVTSSNSNTIKLLITNSSTSSQNIALTMKGGYITNTIQDITTPSTYSEITLVETPSTNTYFCKTNDTLTQGLKYVNGQYTYSYREHGNYASTDSDLHWHNYDFLNNGWGVQLTDKSSTNAVTSMVCTYINNKPITSMSYMFSKSKATTMDLSHFNTSNITNMNGMFNGCETTVLDLSKFNTSNLKNMDSMFSYSKVASLDLSNFDTSNVTKMGYVFSSSQTTIIDVSNFDTSNVISMAGLFYDVNVSTIKGLENLDTSNVTSMYEMFRYSELTSLNLSNFDTSSVTNMGWMFESFKINELDISNFDTSNVTNMDGMFRDSNIQTIMGLENFNTSNVTNMHELFSGSNFTEINLNNFDTSNVTDMYRMFGYSKFTTLDLSSLDTSNVTNMNDLFYGATSLKTIYVSDKFNIADQASGSNMFTYCFKLVGGAGTTYNSSYVDKTYAHIDGGTSNPGYFTDIVDMPSTFSVDDWSLVVSSVKAGNTRGYKVGETKIVDMGTYGTHTLRIANTSTPSECNTNGFSQTACGFVLEFEDIIVENVMNNVNSNKGGWPSSSIKTFINGDLYNAIPSKLQSGIIDTITVSGHGPTSGEENFTSIDKLYLLSTAEVWAQGSSNTIYNDTARDVTRQLDYYKKKNVTTSNYDNTIKKNGTSVSSWWLRSATNSSYSNFFCVGNGGSWGTGLADYSDVGVSPAFRIG